MEHCTLSELMQRIGNSLSEAFPLPVWVVAEIGEMKVNYSGHCYLDLVEKEDEGLKVKAKINATIWSSKFRLLKSFFESTTRIALGEGIKVLVKVDVHFHEIYGLSLNVIDIDPAFTVGDLKLQRNLIVQRLIDEGIVDLNKQLLLPIVPQNIAVISSATAAGFQDFANHLNGNAFGYQFNVTLFAAVMQGNEAEKSIISALDQIYTQIDKFDVVVIIRGGGAQSDLLCFDSYNVAANLAQFPIPVLTGIGHDKDESVADIVAFQNFKTPTAVASFIIDAAASYEGELSQCISAVASYVASVISQNKDMLHRLNFAMLSIFGNALSANKALLNNIALGVVGETQSGIAAHKRTLDSMSMRYAHAGGDAAKAKRLELDDISRRISFAAKTLLLQRKHEVETFSARVYASAPEEIMKRGYSLTLQDGRLLTSVAAVSGQRITTVLKDGRIDSDIVENVKK